LALALAGALASQFEGYRAKPYKDPVGIVTVCEGHTGRDIEQRVYSPAECAEFKRQDMLGASAVVDRCITGPLTVGQRAALIDFAYNVGPGAKGVKDGLCTLKSGKVPTIRRLFNAGEARVGCLEFRKWNAQKLRGIDRRRAAEEATCLA
jgi:lysozyme